MLREQSISFAPDPAALLLKISAIGDLIIVTGAVRGEGTTPYYVPDNFSTVADVRVTAALMKAAEMLGVTCHLGLAWTTDALLRETRERVEEMRALKVKAVDMVSSSILTVAQLYEVAAGINSDRERQPDYR